MSFERISGWKGKIYVPEALNECRRKHSCKDCFSCQNCSDDRCRVCLDPRSRPGKTLSVEK